MDGVIVLKVNENSILATSGLKGGDVIVGVEGKQVYHISDLLSKYQENLWHGSVRLTIVRHQKEMEFHIKSQ